MSRSGVAASREFHLLRPAGAPVGPVLDDLRAGPAGARSLRWFSPRAERRLYDEPKKLAAAGLVVVEEKYVGKRRSRHYTITDEGRAALADWLSEAPAARTTDFEGMVKVFFADAGDRDQLLVTLRRIEEESLARVADLRDLAGRPTNFPSVGTCRRSPCRAMLGEEEQVLTWARWAQEQVARVDLVGRPRRLGPPRRDGCGRGKGA